MLIYRKRLNNEWKAEWSGSSIAGELKYAGFQSQCKNLNAVWLSDRAVQSAAEEENAPPPADCLLIAGIMRNSASCDRSRGMWGLRSSAKRGDAAPWGVFIAV